MKPYDCILLATIEHSGTNEFLAATYRTAVHIKNYSPIIKGAVIYSHLTNDEMPIILELSKIMPLYTTHRCHDDIVKSWINRNKDINDLNIQVNNYIKMLELKPYIIELGKFKS